jgi:hypothetical protein
VADGIPANAFAVDGVQAEFQRRRDLGVRFTQEPLELFGRPRRCSTTPAAT